jgi:hypothetical protein
MLILAFEAQSEAAVFAELVVGRLEAVHARVRKHRSWRCCRLRGERWWRERLTDGRYSEHAVGITETCEREGGELTDSLIIYPTLEVTKV